MPLSADINGRRHEERSAIRLRSSRVWNVFARDISSQTAENASPRLENRLFQRRAVRRSPLLLLLLLLLALESARALVQCTPYNLLEAECFSSVSHFPGRHGIFGKTISSLFRINDTSPLKPVFSSRCLTCHPPLRRVNSRRGCALVWRGEGRGLLTLLVLFLKEPSCLSTACVGKIIRLDGIFYDGCSLRKIVSR